MERINELTEIQNSKVRTAYKMLFANTEVDLFTHLDMGVELDVDLIKRISTEYAMAKKQALEEASKTVDVDNMKHIAEDRTLIGETLERSAADWNAQKNKLYKQTGYRPTSDSPCLGAVEFLEDNEDDFGKELEDVLLIEHTREN
ncbi:unnamed protein product [Cuscuta europaea]|nr:unnamed protein product [Cuscuta europaea]